MAVEFQIAFELNEQTLAKVMTEVDKTLYQTLKKKGKEICKRLAKEVGQPAAQGAFGEPITVTTKSTRNGWKVLADGEQVCFLEFGAGATTASNHPFADEVPFRVYAGSWSESPHGQQQYSEKGYWYYGGERYTHITPKAGMYIAYKRILQEVERIATEVFYGSGNAIEVYTK